MFEREILELVLRPGRVNQIAREHRVGAESSKRDAMLREHDGVELQVVSRFLHGLVFEDRPQHLERGFHRQTRRFAERAVSSRHVVRVSRRCRERQADNRRAHRGRSVGQYAQREPPGAAKAPGQFLHIVDRVDRPISLGNRAGGWRVFLDECPEAELVENLEAPLARPAPVPQRFRIELDRYIGPDFRELAALPRRVDVRKEPFTVALVLHLGRVREEILQRSVLRDQLLRALVADAGNPLDVVDRVAHQREDVDDKLRWDAELLLDALGVVPGALFLGIPDADPIADELKEILVAGHDRHLETGGRRLFRQRPDHIVGLEALGSKDRHAERLACGMHHRNLFGELVGHRCTVGFVVGYELVAEGWTGEIERRRDVRRLVLVQELAKHRDEDIDGVGGSSLRVSEQAAFRGADGRMVRAVHLRAAVDQVKRGLARHAREGKERKFVLYHWRLCGLVASVPR